MQPTMGKLQILIFYFVLLYLEMKNKYVKNKQKVSLVEHVVYGGQRRLIQQKT
jgi:hypothetical protein